MMFLLNKIKQWILGKDYLGRDVCNTNLNDLFICSEKLLG